MLLVGGGALTTAKTIKATTKSACVSPHRAVWSHPAAQERVGRGGGLGVAQGEGGGGEDGACPLKIAVQKVGVGNPLTPLPWRYLPL